MSRPLPFPVSSSCFKAFIAFFNRRFKKYREMMICPKLVGEEEIHKRERIKLPAPTQLPKSGLRCEALSRSLSHFSSLQSVLYSGLRRLLLWLAYWKGLDEETKKKQQLVGGEKCGRDIRTRRNWTRTGRGLRLICSADCDPPTMCSNGVHSPGWGMPSFRPVP